MSTVLYSLGIVVQAAAAVFAFLYLRYAQRKLPWLLIALSMLLVMGSRTITLAQTLKGAHQLTVPDVLALAVSLLFLFGIVLITQMAREARRNQMALKRSEAALRIKDLVFDVSVAANSIADLDGRLTEVNQAFVRIWGCQRKEELLGKNVGELLEDASQARAVFEELKRSGRWEGELVAKRSDGSTFFARGFATVVCGQSGTAIGYQSAVMDMTAYKETETALRRSEALLAQAQEIAHIGSWELDLATSQLTWSDETYRIFGAQPQEFPVTNETFLSMVHPEDRARVDGAYSASIREGQARYQTEHRLIRKGTGEVRHVLERCYHERDASGAVIRSVGMVQDVTDRKREEEERLDLERKLQQLQKSESLGRMAGAIAHHFNNQLQAIMMNLEVAIGDLSHRPDLIEALMGAMQAARKVAEINSLMLTYLGKTIAERQPLDVSEVWQRHVLALRGKLPKNAVLQADLGAPGLVIRGNEGQLRQVLSQLVTNAWEAGGNEGGAIGLRVRLLSPTEIPSANRFPLDWSPIQTAYVCLEVADTGCGIAEEDIERLFDPFYSTKFTGRGLGLPVVLGIVRGHEGAIAVESTPAWGSVFRVFLPLSPETATSRLEPAPSAQASAAAGTGAVLLVEDDPAIREAVVSVLNRFAFRVLSAADGVKAVEVFRAHPGEIGCVVTNLNMPRMNGWETLAALRGLAPGIPVILASGYSESEALAGEHPEKPQAFLSKPYDSKALIDAITRLMPAKKS